jgi:DNA polymerase/3'-5' exonuclease PolX
MSEPMELTRAVDYAAKIVAWLSPFCETLLICGSVRRMRPMCNDIDLVVIPKRGQAPTDLLGVATGPAENVLRTELVRYVRAGDWKKEGKPEWRGGVEPKEDAENFLLALAKCDLDVFCATPATWGTMVMCRTGSKEHNVWIAQRAQGMGLHWNPYKGLTKDGHTLLTLVEGDIYEALAMPFVPPEKRELDVLQGFERRGRIY